VPRRQLGRYLKDFREKGGITIQAAANALEWSTAKIWRIETGQVALRSHDVEAMCKVYQAPHDITGALVGLARETKARGWWHAYGDAVPDWFELYVGLETAAARLRQYEPELIPGLLQTKAYTYAFLRIERPEITDDELDRRAAVKLQRQNLLVRRLPPPPQLEVILCEAALRRPIADREAMAGQLDHLVSMTAGLAHVAVRVLPLAAGPTRASLGGSFVILDFAAGEPSTVYCEGVTGALYLDKAPEVATYGDIWKSVAGQALDTRESIGLITSLAEEYHHD
jgi:transcriptional regulator with XRE-family HTH domain